MKDIRLKILVVLALSVASFIHVIAALFVLVWWIIHDRQKKQVVHSRPFWIYMTIIALFAVLIQLEGGDGVSYLVRFEIIALIAVWAYRIYSPGEFLDVAVWAFGKKWGFELGLIAEMSMQGLRVLREDMDRIRMALLLKGIRWGGRSLPSMLSLLLLITLRRSDAQSQLLALRGYRNGGEHCPHFNRNASDILSTGAALAILAFALSMAYLI